MRFRNAEPNDFDACIALLAQDGGFRAEPAVHSALGQLWLEHLNNESFASFQVFESKTEQGWEIVAFRNSVFVSTEFRYEYSAAPHPQVAAEIWKRVTTGNSPILNEEEIAIANGRHELNLLVMHWVVRHRDPTHPETTAVLALSTPAWQRAHFGYRGDHLTAYEVFGPEAAAVMKKIGYQPYELVGKDGKALESNESQSSVFYWGRDNDSFALAALASFECPEPRFHFSRAEQRLLNKALDDHTDKDIAEILGVRHDTIRRRWESIYRRVEETDDTILPSTNTPEGKRGSARRHLLLEYLRQHLEEIRPFKAPKQMTVSA